MEFLKYFSIYIFSRVDIGIVSATQIPRFYRREDFNLEERRNVQALVFHFCPTSKNCCSFSDERWDRRATRDEHEAGRRGSSSGAERKRCSCRFYSNAKANYAPRSRAPARLPVRRDESERGPRLAVAVAVAVAAGKRESWQKASIIDILPELAGSQVDVDRRCFYFYFYCIPRCAARDGMRTKETVNLLWSGSPILSSMRPRRWETKEPWIAWMLTLSDRN